MADNLEHLSVTSDHARSTLRVASAVIRAGIYVRISSDRTGAGLGVARQEEDCRALCTRQGWTVYRVYVDNDVSAYSGKRRPAWDELLADVAAGQVSAVVCWHVDRLTRSPRELEEVIDLHDQRGIVLATVTGEMDLSTPTGRMLARMLGAAARHEAEHQAERRARAGLQKARAGLPHKAGSRRGYGYAPDGVTIIEAEAAIIREARDRVTAGESPRSVAADLNDRGVTSATGQQWTAEALRKILASGRISGRREHHGVIVHEESWPAIIPAADSDRLRELLARRPGLPRADARRYLMSGIFTCGNCQAGLYGQATTAGTLRYACTRSPGLPGCGTLAVIAAPAETRARDLVLTALDGPDFLAALITATSGNVTPAGEIIARLRDADERREELARDWAAGEISRKEWHTARDQITAVMDKLTADLSRTRHSATLASFAAAGGSVWDRWETMTTGGRRALMKATVAAIPVHPAAGRRWNPARIGTPLWRA